MSITTTCIGAYPKPDYLNVRYQAEAENQSDENHARRFHYTFEDTEPDSEQALIKATVQAVEDQIKCGIDIPTDGEQRRENYIHYHCRHLTGIDFENLNHKVHRNGAAVANLPTIHGKVEPKGHHFLDRDYHIAQQASDRPVKITLPGPLGIADTTVNKFYKSDRELAFDLADALNFEVHALIQAGCKYIQVDEALFMRRVDDALDYGIECLERCFDGAPDDVTRVVHMCCGYPGHLDDENYLKADPAGYFRLAKRVDESSVHQISIEDAHCQNDLKLLEEFQNSTVLLGVVTIASSQVESVEHVSNRLNRALDHIDKSRLIAAPDCGLVMLGRELAITKMKNMCEAARTF